MTWSMTPTPSQVTEVERSVLKAAAHALQSRAEGTGLDLPTSIADRLGQNETPGAVELILRDLAARGHFEIDPPNWATHRPPMERIPIVGLSPQGRAVVELPPPGPQL